MRWKSCGAKRGDEELPSCLCGGPAPELPSLAHLAADVQAHAEVSLEGQLHHSQQVREVQAIWGDRQREPEGPGPAGRAEMCPPTNWAASGPQPCRTCPQEETIEALAELGGRGPLGKAGSEAQKTTVSQAKPLATPLRQAFVLLQSAQDLWGPWGWVTTGQDSL